MRWRSRVTSWARRGVGLWICVATATVSAALGVLGLLLQLPSAPTGGAYVLFVAFLVLTGLSVALPVAGYLGTERERRAEVESARSAQVARVLAEGAPEALPRLSTLSDDRLGATPTRHSKGGNAPYVGRGDHDERLVDALRAPGPPYPFVVVRGASKAGKSRTVAEAARRAFPHDPEVIVPVGGARLSELAHGDLARLVTGPPGLVWLDNADVADLEALSTPVLDALRAHTALVVTITAQRHYQALTGGERAATTARAALNQAVEHELPFEATDAEKAEAARLYPDERFTTSIAEALVGGQELLSRYRAGQDSMPAGAAVVRAAVDARRAGLVRPLREAELYSLFEFHLCALRPDLDATPERFAEGLAWAAEPVASSVALLARTNAGWQVLDYAVDADDGDGGHSYRLLPDDLWHLILTFLRPADAGGVALAALLRGQREVAQDALRLATSDSADGPLAWLGLGDLLVRQLDFDEAVVAYRNAADSGHPEILPFALLRLGTQLWRQGDFAAAETELRAAVATGHPVAGASAAVILGLILVENDDLDGAWAAADTAHELGYQHVMLMRDLFTPEETGQPNDVVGLGVDPFEHAALMRQLLNTLARRDPERNHERVLRNVDDFWSDFYATFGEAAAAEGLLAMGFGSLGDEAGAERVLRRMATWGDAEAKTSAELSLTIMALLRDGDEEAEAALRLVADGDEPGAAVAAVFVLGIHAFSHEDYDVAEANFRQVIRMGTGEDVEDALSWLGRVLTARDDLAGAKAALRRAARSRSKDIAHHAAIGLGEWYVKRGKTRRAKVTFRRVMSSGRPALAAEAELNLGVLLGELGDLAGEEAAYRHVLDKAWVPESIRQQAALLLGVLLTDTTREDEGLEILQAFVDEGDSSASTTAALQVGLVLHRRGDLAGAAAAYRHAQGSLIPEVAEQARQNLNQLAGD